jgi:choline dehydrogenase
MLEGLELCRRLVETRAARDAWSEQLIPDPGLDAGGLRDWCAASLSSYFHPVGTCAMGRAGDGASTVDADGRVHGIEGLYVADASIIPTVPRANTNLAVLALAERLGERFAVI